MFCSSSRHRLTAGSARRNKYGASAGRRRRKESAQEEEWALILWRAPDSPKRSASAPEHLSHQVCTLACAPQSRAACELESVGVAFPHTGRVGCAQEGDESPTSAWDPSLGEERRRCLSNLGSESRPGRPDALREGGVCSLSGRQCPWRGLTFDLRSQPSGRKRILLQQLVLKKHQADVCKPPDLPEEARRGPTGVWLVGTVGAL